MKRSDTAKWIAGGFCLVVAVEVLATVLVSHRFLLVASGAALAVVLLAGRRLVGGVGQAAPAEAVNDVQTESMRRWISRTQSMIRWADASRSDWDRHLRPRLAREFFLATGQRQGKDPAALQVTGRIVFGDELWPWVDPSNVDYSGSRQPGPGRATLEEILKRLERV
ncbi:MAG TPA: hypothetical protein VMU34_22460 [Mycobacterium sp.]|nr:hypothetical protein [Mycobacterium sp.]